MKLSTSWWKQSENFSSFFDWFAKKRNLSNPSDWYEISSFDIRSFGGPASRTSSVLLMKYLGIKYPTFEWIPWKFQIESKNFVADRSVRKRFFDAAAEKFGVTDLEGWYSITPAQLESFGGKTVSLYFPHHIDLIKGLREAYPEHTFFEWKFQTVPRRWWRKRENQSQFMEWLYQDLKLSSLEGWYNVETDIIIQAGGALGDFPGKFRRRFFSSETELSLLML